MNTITEGPEVTQGPPDRHGVVAVGPSTALADLRGEIDRAFAARAAGVESPSTIQTRADLREAAVIEARRTPGAPPLAQQIEPETARRWAQLDVTEFAALPSAERRDAAIAAMSVNTRVLDTAYAAELGTKAPLVAERTTALSQAFIQAELDRKAFDERLAAGNVTKTAALLRQTQFDAEALERVERLRAAQRESVSAALAAEPSRASAQPGAVPRDASAPLLAAGQTPVDASTRTPALPLAAGAAAVAKEEPAAIKRPIREDEISAELRGRFVVTSEAHALGRQGPTEFTYRGGQRDGVLAFVDEGKRIDARIENTDRETIRSMVSLAESKKWGVITVVGTDEFRREAWLEASLRDIKVHGFEAREADLKRLEELRAQRAKDLGTGERNAIIAGVAPEQTLGTNQAAPRTAALPEPLDELRARLRGRVVQDAATHLASEHAELKQAKDNKDPSRVAGIEAQWAKQVQRDLSVVDKMQPADLRRLGQLYDSGAANTSDVAVRKVIDDAAARLGVTTTPALDVQKDKQQFHPALHVDGNAPPPGHDKRLEEIRNVMQAQGYTKDHVDRTVAQYALQETRQAHVGRIEAHGAAHYAHDPNKSMSYYVTLSDAEGHKKTIWGVEIKQAIEQAGAKNGSHIVLTSNGMQPVTVPDRRFDPYSQQWVDGEKTVNRNSWQATNLDNVKQVDRAAIASAVDRASAGPSPMRVYDAALARDASLAAAPLPSQQAQVPSPTPTRPPREITPGQAPSRGHDDRGY